MAKVKIPSASNDKAAPEPKRSSRELRTPAAKGNNIRNWRLFRKIPRQEDLAKLTAEYDPNGVGLNRVSIIKLENGEMRYNEDHLDILARALHVSPRDLIGTNPFDAGDIFAVYAGLNDAQKKRAAKLFGTLKR